MLNAMHGIYNISRVHAKDIQLNKKAIAFIARYDILFVNECYCISKKVQQLGPLLVSSLMGKDRWTIR